MIIKFKANGKFSLILCPLKDPIETLTMHSGSDNVEIMIGNETNENIKELFDSLLQNYRKGFENQ